MYVFLIVQKFFSATQVPNTYNPKSWEGGGRRIEFKASLDYIEK
jgi:hypothetical protein